MGFFSFIETFFFISLIITFVLLVMLIYHFKQRILKLEDKTNTMFEIIDDIVKEMKNINSLGNVHNTIPFNLPTNSISPLPLFREDPAPENIKTILIEHHEEDDNDSDIDGETDAETTDSDSTSESDIDSDSDDELEDLNTSHMMLNLEPVLEKSILVENESDIKTILVELGNDVDIFPEIVIVSSEVEAEAESEAEVEVEVEAEAEVEVEAEAEVEAEPEIEVESNPILSETTSNKKEIWENMTPAMLKSLIVQRGITSLDVSKMKKNKLVQILLDSDE